MGGWIELKFSLNDAHVMLIGIGRSDEFEFSSESVERSRVQSLLWGGLTYAFRMRRTASFYIFVF